MRRKTLVLGFCASLLLVPSLLWAQPPEFSGPFIHRFDWNYWFSWADPRSDKRVIIGIDIVEKCADPDLQPESFRLQDIWIPADQDLLVSSAHGNDVVAAVWPRFPLWVDNPDPSGPPRILNCDLFNTTEPLATGTVDLVSTDNDVFAYLGDHDRANSYMVKAQGFMDTPGGEHAVFSGHLKVVWRLSDPSFGNLVRKVSLQIH